MSDKEIDHEFTAYVVCPWCGYEDADGWELFSGGEADSTETECGECGKPFFAEALMTIEYSTRKVEPKPESGGRA